MHAVQMLKVGPGWGCIWPLQCNRAQLSQGSQQHTESMCKWRAQAFSDRHHTLGPSSLAGSRPCVVNLPGRLTEDVKTAASAHLKDWLGPRSCIKLAAQALGNTSIKERLALACRSQQMSTSHGPAPSRRP